jgi:hypothetical protein
VKPLTPGQYRGLECAKRCLLLGVLPPAQAGCCAFAAAQRHNDIGHYSVCRLFNNFVDLLILLNINSEQMFYLGGTNSVIMQNDTVDCCNKAVGRGGGHRTR